MCILSVLYSVLKGDKCCGKKKKETVDKSKSKNNECQAYVGIRRVAVLKKMLCLLCLEGDIWTKM